MHQSIQNLIKIKNKIKLNCQFYNNINIIAVSKTFPLDNVLSLVDYGHDHFGENKVQEAIEKWTDIKKEKEHIKLHLIGKLQTNKVKYAVRLFDYIHSLDSIKLAKKIAEEQTKQSKKIKIFIQVNLANEIQKSGVQIDELDELYNSSIQLNLDIIGLMCIPPEAENSEKYFKQLKKIRVKFGLKDLSMGMSSDYLLATKHEATFIRIGSEIFGKRN